jgi:uncharacterized membrane protein
MHKGKGITMSGNRILKKSRIESLTDGIFAVAMTILALSIQLPANTSVTQLSEVLSNSVARDFFIFAGSFIILGTQWVAMHFQQGFLMNIDRTYCWLTLLFLLLMCVVPFSASLLMKYPHEELAIYIYAGNLLLSNLFQWGIWEYAIRKKLNNNDLASGYKLVTRRIIVAPIFYLLGMLISPWSISIAFFVLILPPLFYLFPCDLDRFTKEL